MASVTTLEKQIEKLEAEREALQADAARFQAERAAFQGTLTAAQAAAERGGAVAAAEQAEAHDLDLLRKAQRKQAALAAVEGEIADARAALALAQRAAQEKALKDNRKQAGELADQLEKDLNNRANWQALHDLHAEQMRLAVALYGDTVAMVLDLPGGNEHGLWLRPARGLARRLDTIARLATGGGLAGLLGLPEPVGTEHTAYPTLRVALEL